MQVTDPVPALAQLVTTIDEVRRSTFGVPILRRLRTAAQAVLDELRTPTQPFSEHLNRVATLSSDLQAVVERTPGLPAHIRRRLSPAIADAGRDLTAMGRALVGKAVTAEATSPPPEPKGRRP